jgi:hypothetical protein
MCQIHLGYDLDQIKIRNGVSFCHVFVLSTFGRILDTCRNVTLLLVWDFSYLCTCENRFINKKVDYFDNRKRRKIQKEITGESLKIVVS